MPSVRRPAAALLICVCLALTGPATVGSAANDAPAPAAPAPAPAGSATPAAAAPAADPSAPNPSAPPPGIPEAMAKVQAGVPAAAVAIMKAVTAREPENARAWRVLGYAALQAKDAATAIAAYEKALAIEPGIPPAMYNLGAAHAIAGDRERALAWLEKAAATRRLDMTQIEVDDDLATLREEPRFRALLPGPADFEHPFVEEVRILRQWNGEAANDQFGWIARLLGDVDGDGDGDLVT